MIRDVKLINHLPPFLQDYKELKVITEVENPEFQKVMDESERLMDNTFILTADEDGISRFEEILKIYSSKDEELEPRRSRVLSRWNDVIPYTYHVLIEKIINLQGNDNIVVDRKLNEHLIEVTTNLESPGNVEELERILDYMVPANLIVKSNNTLLCHAKGNISIGVGQSTARMFTFDGLHRVDENVQVMRTEG